MKIINSREISIKRIVIKEDAKNMNSFLPLNWLWAFEAADEIITSMFAIAINAHNINRPFPFN